MTARTTVPRRGIRGRVVLLLILLARIATIASLLLLALLPRETGTYMRMAGGCVIKPVGIEKRVGGGTRTYNDAGIQRDDCILEY